MGYLNRVPRTFRYLSVVGLFFVGAVPVSGMFYEVFARLPSYTSFFWKGILGISLGIAAAGLLAAWLIFLTFDILMKT